LADVFISYSRKDVARSKAIASFLKQEHFSVAFDPDFLSVRGAVYRERIAQELDRAKVVIVLWSRDSIESGYVRAEANRAGRTLLQLIIDDLPESDVPLGFGELKERRCEWTLTGELAPQSKEALLRALKRRISEPEKGTARVAKVFISATTLDLSEYRAAAAQKLLSMGHEPLMFEELASEERGPLETSYALIAQCDVFVCIAAWRYGYVPPPYDNPGERSFVELEFRHAQTLRKPVLVYMISPDAEWPPRFFDSGAAGERIAAFRQELEKHHTVTFIRSVEEIVTRLALDLQRLLDPHGRETRFLPSGIDPLELAWRLVVDHKAEPTLLLQMDPVLLHASVEKWAAESGAPTDPVEPMYTTAVSQLRDRQATTAPSALWLAWMRATRSHLFDDVKPPLSGPDIVNAESAHWSDPDSGPQVA
jgi:hypothetical protein